MFGTAHDHSFMYGKDSTYILALFYIVFSGKAG